MMEHTLLTVCGLWFWFHVQQNTAILCNLLSGPQTILLPHQLVDGDN